MLFDIHHHNNIPLGFKPAKAVRKDPDAPRRGGKYETCCLTRDDLSLYGQRFGILSTLVTQFTPRRFASVRGASTQQHMSVSLFSRTVLEEQEGGHPGPGEIRVMGDHDFDPEKVETGNKILKAIKAKLEESGEFREFDFSVNTGQSTLAMVLKQNSPEINPIEAVERLHKHLRALSTVYERGEKPLGAIAEPMGAIRINQHLKRWAGSSQRNEHPQKPAEDTWESEVRQDDSRQTAKDILKLAEWFFPVGKEVTAANHTLFKDEVEKKLGIGHSRG